MIDTLCLALLLGDFQRGGQLLMAEFCLDALRPETVPESIRKLRSRGADLQFAVISGFHQEGFRTDLLLILLKKKLELLACATTQNQVQEILRGSIPRYYAGKIEAGSPYHVEEEELIYWSRVSKAAPMTFAAKNRALELFERCRERLEAYRAWTRPAAGPSAGRQGSADVPREPLNGTVPGGSRPFRGPGFISGTGACPIHAAERKQKGREAR